MFMVKERIIQEAVGAKSVFLAWMADCQHSRLFQ